MQPGPPKGNGRQATSSQGPSTQHYKELPKQERHKEAVKCQLEVGPSDPNQLVPGKGNMRQGAAGPEGLRQRTTGLQGSGPGVGLANRVITPVSELGDGDVSAR